MSPRTFGGLLMNCNWGEMALEGLNVAQNVVNVTGSRTHRARIQYYSSFIVIQSGIVFPFVRPAEHTSHNSVPRIVKCSLNILLILLNENLKDFKGHLREIN